MVCGFTLIEIMVVVLIIGIMYGVAVFALGNRELEAVRTTAERLHATLRLAAEETIIRAQPIGFSLTEEGYAFLLADAEGEWRRIETDRALGPRTLPPVVNAEMAADAPPEALRAQDDAATPAAGLALGAEADEDTAERLPQTVLLPTGEMVPFRITLRGSEPRPRWLIEGTINGAITLERQN